MTHPICRRRGCPVLTVLLLLAVSLPLVAQEPAEVERLRKQVEQDRQVIEGMKQEMDGCKQLIQDLTKRLESVENHQRTGPAAVGPAPSECPEAGSIRDVEGRLDRVEGLPVLGQHFAIQLFGEAKYSANNRHDTTSDFRMGNLDLVVNSALTDKCIAFAEIAFEHFREVGHEGEEEMQHTTVDLERLYLKYEFAEYFGLKMGREHTPFGYWNTAYHHGFYLQTTVERPLMTRFEHDVISVVPSHIVGLEADGTILPGAGLSYSLYVTNGRGSTREEIQTIEDVNEHKAFGFRIEEKFPGALDGLKLGVSGYFDRLDITHMEMDEMAMEEVEVVTAYREMILGAHAVYERDPFEVVGEYYWLRHYGLDFDDDREGNGGYVLAAIQANDWLKPYAKFERINVPGEDPVFEGIDDTNVYTGGVRIDFIDQAALKLEYSHWHIDDDGDDETDDSFGEFLFDVSFRF